MGRKVFVISVSAVLIVSFAFAEVITLKSGKVIEADIIERTDRFIKIDFEGISLTYFFDEIENIKSVKPKPPFKTVRITYKTTQKMFDEHKKPVLESTGKKIVTVDVEHSRRRDEETSKITMGDFQKRDKTLNIFDGERLYSIRPAEKRATYVDIPEEGRAEAWMDEEGDEKFFVGVATVLNRPCKIYKRGTYKMWLWNSLVLKEEIKSEYSHVFKEATKIEENISVRDSDFTLPENIEVKSIEAALSETVKGVTDIMEDYSGRSEVHETEEAVPTAGVSGESVEGEDLNLFDLGKAAFDPETESKFVEAIKNDPSMSEEEKREALKNFDEMLKEQKKMVKQARTEDGKIDIDKFVEVTQKERVRAYEKMVVANLEMIHSAFQHYRLAYQRYPESLEELASVEPPFIPASLGRGVSSGYKYEVVKKGEDKFLIRAFPDASSSLSSGRYSFCVMEDGVVHINRKGGLITSVSECAHLPECNADGR